jgi:hypothetical protein
VIARFGQREFAIEVYVTHRCPPEKLERFEARGLSAFEIDLAALRHGVIDNQFTQQVIEDAPRAWLFNPRQKDADARLAKKWQREFAAWYAQQARERREERKSREDAMPPRIRTLVQAWRAAAAGRPSAPPHFLSLRDRDAVAADLGSSADSTSTPPFRPGWSVAIVVASRDDWTRFTLSDALRWLNKHGYICEGLNGHISREDASEAEDIEFSFQTPYSGLHGFVTDARGHYGPLLINSTTGTGHCRPIGTLHHLRQ